MRTTLFLCFALSTLLLSVTAAHAAVDLEVPLSAKIRGTIAGPGSTETYRFHATAGTQLKFLVAGKGLSLSVALRDPEGSPVSLAGVPGYRDSGSKVSLGKFVLEKTGLYSLDITSAAEGAYAFKLKGKPGKKGGGTVSVPAGGSVPLRFAAPAGSIVVLKAKAGKGSAAEPRFGDLAGLDLSNLGKSSVKGHAVQVEVGAGGDLEVEVKNLGDEDGDVAVKLKIKAPRFPGLKLDVRAEDLGDAADGGTALGRHVDSETGGEVSVDDETSSIDGAGVKIDAGALPEDVTVVVLSAAPVEPPADRQAAGPTVEFGPAGLTFTKPVEVSIPYDPASIPTDATTADLRVLHVKGDGGEETLVPVDVDEANRLLTVETTSFSKFRPNAPKGPATVAGRQYWFVDLLTRLEPDPDWVKGDLQNGYDSRERVLAGGRGVATFAAARQPGTFDSTDIVITWGHKANGEGYANWVQNPRKGTVEWDTGTGPKNLVIDGSSMEMNASGSVLFNTADDPDPAPGSGQEPETEIFTSLLVEKSRTAPTFADLAGEYRFVEAHCEVAEVTEAGLPHDRIQLTTIQIFGNLSFKKNGTISVSATEKIVTRPPLVSPFSETNNFSESGIRYSILGSTNAHLAGAIVVDGITLFPSADRNVIIGLNLDGDDGPGLTLFVAVRQSGTPALSGSYRIRGTYLDPTIFSEFTDPQMGDMRELNDLWVTGVSGTGTASGGQFSYTVEARQVYRDTGKGSGVTVEYDTVSDSEPLGTDSKGFITIDGSSSEPMSGAVTPDGSFGVFQQLKATRDVRGQPQVTDTVGFFLFLN